MIAKQPLRSKNFNLFNSTRIRSLELDVEKQERHAKQLFAEKEDLELKLSDMTNKYNNVKHELDQTLKDLEGL